MSNELKTQTCRQEEIVILANVVGLILNGRQLVYVLQVWMTGLARDDSERGQ